MRTWRPTNGERPWPNSTRSRFLRLPCAYSGMAFRRGVTTALIQWWKGRDSNPRPRHYEQVPGVQATRPAWSAVDNGHTSFVVTLPCGRREIVQPFDLFCTQLEVGGSRLARCRSRRRLLVAREVFAARANACTARPWPYQDLRSLAARSASNPPFHLESEPLGRISLQS